MKLPSASAPMVHWTCPRCGTHALVPEGDRIPSCECDGKRPSELYDVNIYELVSGHPDAAKFHAQALPMGQRPISVYGDSAEMVEKQAVRLLDAPWDGGK